MIKFQPYKRKNFFPRLLVISALALLLLLASPFYLRPMCTVVLVPVQWTAAFTLKSVASIPAFFFHLASLNHDNQSLRQEVKILQARLLSFDALQAENNRLHTAAGLRQSTPYHLRLLPAQVIGRAPSNWFSILEINQGSRAGVRENATVITRDGLVGKIVSCDFFSARVKLLTDGQSQVAALDGLTRDSGIVTGGLPGYLGMKYMESTASIKIGDPIVTASISTSFPPGIPIGQVSALDRRENDLFYQVKIKPAVKFSRLEEVFVVTNFN